MKISSSLRSLARRLAGSAPGKPFDLPAGNPRRTAVLPSIFNTYSPRADLLPKATPVNLRRFAETPVARKAINTIKDRVAGMRWRIQPKNGRAVGADVISRDARIRVLADNFDSPNAQDSFRSLAEQVLEDVIVGGFGAIEVQLTADPARPLALWPVDGSTILVRSDWNGDPGGIRYVQAVSPYGLLPGVSGLSPAPAGQDRRPASARGVELRDDELSYIRLNPRTHTPFGLGRLEVAFESINAFLSAHRYAARLASNSVVQYALWLQSLTPAHHERLIRWWQDEIEGTGRVPILSVETKPEVLRFGGGTDQDLRLGWQEFLLRIIADAFDLPPMYLGLEHDVNRSTASELSDEAFATAIVPTARLLAEHLTRDIIGKKLGWDDLEFVFTELDSKDEMQEAQIQTMLLGAGVLTVNEVRAMRGLPPL
ncbi:MAG TPA: phage portal protein [Terriglobales bacterium]|nr:phage portal protein [Terriglobales bacterium]